MSSPFRPDPVFFFTSIVIMMACLAVCIPPAYGGGNVSGRNVEQAALPQDTRIDRLVVSKSGRIMTAWFKGRKVKAYRVGLGQNALGPKEVDGDKKTPEGLYYVTGKALSAKYYKRLAISYPNAADRKNAATKGLNPGSGVSIHGLGREFSEKYGAEHWRRDWTGGGIAVTNNEIDELFMYTDIGARVEIIP